MLTTFDGIGRRIFALWLLICAIFLATPAASDEPVLRIETGGHTATILGLAVSSDGSKVATGAYDQTVRVWSLPDLNLLRTIHLPVGEGVQGAANTVAFSPDNKTLITTGQIGNWDGESGPWCFYVIDWENAEITRAVCDLPRVAKSISYSPDGRYFALVLEHGQGLRVYHTSDFSLAAADATYGDTSTWLDFDASGRVVTCALDGKVRLYDNQFRLIASGTMPEGRKPLTVSFSPDGSQVGVAYAEPEGDDPRWAPAIDVLSATDLSVLFRPDVRGIDNGALWRLAWSSDGKFLYAGGTWQKGTRFPLRRWADGGRGRPLDVASAPARILRIRQVPTGGVVFVGEVPYIGVVGPSDRLVAEHPVSVADYTHIGDKLAVSADGLTVQFAFDAFGEKPTRFSLETRVLQPGELPDSLGGVSRPITENPDVDLRNWSWSYKPTLNGEPLSMKPHDVSMALSFTPDGHSFVLGTSWEIIRYNARGQITWRTPVRFNTHGIVITPDGRLAVAAIGDGTIRWYAMDTGKELLAFFPHRDGKRWVAWTPSGYYMTSVDGESLIGWQVNRGRESAADFFSVGRFSSKYYRPDIVLRTLASLDEERAIREARSDGVRTNSNLKLADLLPPVISIQEPRDGAAITDPRVKVRYRVRAPSGEAIDQIIVRSGGRLLGTFDAPGLDAQNEATGEIEIAVPRRDSELLMFARNRFAVSEPARVKLKWANQNFDVETDLRNVYVLAIGVGKYGDAQLDLDFPAKDAADFVGALQRQKGRAYINIWPRVLTDRQATLAHIREGLAWLGRSVGPDDIGMVFLAGHGFDAADGTYYYLPSDADIRRLTTTSLSFKELIAGLNGIGGVPALFVDTCHAGDVFGRRGRASMDVIGLVNRVSEPSNGVIVYASSTGNQLSLESSEWENGAFTRAVVDGLNGEAQYRQRNYITTSMLATYVKERVKDLTTNRQAPTVNMPLAVPDLLLARVGTDEISGAIPQPPAGNLAKQPSPQRKNTRPRKDQKAKANDGWKSDAFGVTSGTR
jgi:WD40 repeat protein